MPKPRRGSQTRALMLPATQLSSARGNATKFQFEEGDLSELMISAAEALITQLGGRISAGELLAVAGDQPEHDEDRSLVTLTTLLLDPRYDKIPLSQLCEQAGLTLRDFFVSYRTAALARAQILATERIASFLPKVAEDVMRRAAPYEEPCETCQGIGTFTPDPTKKQPNPSPGPCPECQGTGKIKCLPELERQKVALELGDLLKRGGGGISLTQQTAVMNGAIQGTAGGYERFQQALASALAGPLPPLASPTDVAEPIEIAPEAEADHA